MTAGYEALATSDKFFWHRYGDLYARTIGSRDADAILEFGLDEGASLRWLGETFPKADIYGLDIELQRGSWPTGNRFRYSQVNQSDRAAVGQAVRNFGRRFDIVIDDGSHVPQHQFNCLMETLPHMPGGALYVLEDLHTASRELRDERVLSPNSTGKRRRHRRFFQNNRFANVLTILWAFERARALELSLELGQMEALASASGFRIDDLERLDGWIASIEIYQRAQLPLACWKCRSTGFDLINLLCQCGVELMQPDDSMTAVITVK
jgi:hypothetical protein